MSRWPRDNQQALIDFYGDPGTGAVERQLVHVTPPFAMYYGRKRVKSLLFHKKAADALLVALNDVWARCGKDQGKIDSLGISKTAGTYNKRRIAGSTHWSNHAFGAAIDINAAENGFNTGHGTIPPVLIAAFDAVGFRWGGRYKGRTDPMHFEACDDGQPHPVGLLDAPISAGVEFAAYDGSEPHDAGCTFDAADQDDEHDHDEPVPADGGSVSFFQRWRNRISGLAGGGMSLGFLGYLTNWQVVAILCGFIFIMLASVVGFIIFFFGADPVRDWVRKQAS